MLTFFGWYSLVLMAVSTLFGIATIGKPREPVTAGVMAIVVVLNAPIIWFIAVKLAH